MTYLNIASIINNTYAEGPGLRTAIWVQGCLKRCVGCCNPEFLSISKKIIFDLESLCELIQKNQKKYLISGITLLGGEPFLQAQGLAEVAAYSQSLGLSVMTFSGYSIEELCESNFHGAEKLLRHSDLVIDGEYVADQPEVTRNWVGSKNQRFNYLSNFYDTEIETTPLEVTNEWRINSDGILLANGLPVKIK